MDIEQKLKFVVRFASCVVRTVTKNAKRSTIFAIDCLRQGVYNMKQLTDYMEKIP